MNKKYICAGVMSLLALSTAYADPPKGFEEFRKGLMENYNNFRSRILEHYADFLAGEWHEYEALEGEQKYSEPKPSAMPVIDNLQVEEGDEQKKEMLASFGFTAPKILPDNPVPTSPYLNWIQNTPNLYSAPIPSLPQGTDIQPESEPQLNQSLSMTGDIATENGLRNHYDGEIFPFYGMKFALPYIDFEILPKIIEIEDLSNQWRLLDEQNLAERILPSIRRLQRATGLSDYLLYPLLMAYAEKKFPDANDASRMSLTHYLLTNMQFAVRLALDNNGEPYLMIPFNEKVYGCSNLPLGGITYYLFSTPGREHIQRMGLRTPGLPTDADLGKPLNLRMKGLRIPNNPHHYSFEHAGLKLEGDMNRNIIPMLHKYPKMDTSGFAASMISKDVRDDVARQIKEQLGDQDPLKAADRLLAMIQFAFPYATDDEFHGFEKPYFFEETLFYPKSDCEDRAVFYSYLLWNALGLENDLIAYPNHEATALKAENVWGGDMYYTRDGQRFYISDPTFQGAPTGQGMSRFRDVEPVIDLSYTAKKKESDE